jgi:hypothetical protein
MKFIFYKHKVAGPIPEDKLDYFIDMWKQMVDSGKATQIPDSPFLNEYMKNFPNDVHIFYKTT